MMFSISTSYSLFASDRSYLHLDSVRVSIIAFSISRIDLECSSMMTRHLSIPQYREIDSYFEGSKE